MFVKYICIQLISGIILCHTLKLDVVVILTLLLVLLSFLVNCVPLHFALVDGYEQGDALEESTDE